LADKCPQISIQEGLSKLPRIDDYDKKDNHLIIFDDLVLSKDLSMVENAYIRCRKINISVIFISQSYFKIPKMIRLNTNYFVLLKLPSNRDLNMILADASLGVDKKELNNIYKYAIHGDITNFLLIDLVVPSEQSFRKCFDQIIDINNFV
jgi:hypothetical protein